MYALVSGLLGGGGCSVYEPLASSEPSLRTSATSMTAPPPMAAAGAVATPNSAIPAAAAREAKLPPVAAPPAIDADAGTDIETEFGPHSKPRVDAGTGTVLDAGAMTSEGPNAPADGCSRDELLQSAEKFFAALASGDSRSLALHPSARYTENGQAQTLGLGLWLSGPRSEFTRHVLDTEACSSLSEAVLSDNLGRVVYGVRLRYIEAQLLEVEAHVVRPNAQYFEPDQIIPSGPDAWVQPLPPQRRSAAPSLRRLAMSYFDSTADASLLPPSAPGCERRQNGELMPNQGSCRMPPGSERFDQQRYPVADEVSGIVTAVVKYTDFIGMYLIKVQDGAIQNIEVVGGAASASTGW